METLQRPKSSDWRYRIVKDKNPAFDGIFYFGVRTTGIFCRPSCSSKTPKAENVSFYASVNDAEHAGFRACLRCKPTNELHIDKNAEIVACALNSLRDDEIATIDQLS